MAAATVVREPASFRDPAGFVYRRDGSVLRQVDRSFADRWRLVLESGFLADQMAAGRLLPFESVSVELAADPSRAVAVLRPEPVPFISYPYEWTFGELKDAALLTLDLQRAAVAAGLRLRDASAYNVQFVDCKPVFIDALSFEPAVLGAPWPAYRQFCEHFLAPLALMAHRDPRSSILLRDFLDGIPLDLAARLLPGRTRLSVGLGAHLHLHARSQARHAGDVAAKSNRGRVSRTGGDALLDSLRRAVAGLAWTPAGTTWGAYDDAGPHAEPSIHGKEAAVRELLAHCEGSVVWDLGANTGRYSGIAASMGLRVIAWDADPAASERHYRRLRADHVAGVLPLVTDLANPSPAIGWANEERRSFVDRADADVVLALALVHHLSIGRSVPLAHVADLLARLGRWLIIEWVPPSDPLAQRLIAARSDVRDDYSTDGFLAAFGVAFETIARQPVPQSERTVFLMRRRS